MNEIEFIIPDAVSKEILKTVNSEKATEETQFKKRLIERVRRERVIYDTNCISFSNTAAKEEAWHQISGELEKDVNTCKNTWICIRYAYQGYVRRLQKFLHSGNKYRRRRPVMVFEKELLFLWRFVTNRDCNVDRPKCNEITEIAPAAEEDDVVLVTEDPPIIVIDVDEPETKKQHSPQITEEVRKFLELLQAYPELYDTKNCYFNDYRRKGIIWNALANELKDKGTKLMKHWIYLQARYEWEINQKNSKEVTELERLLGFLRPHILINPNTVYKQSQYLKDGWHEPIEHFKNIFQLLVLIRKFPVIVNYSDKNLLDNNKPLEYHKIWLEIGRLRGVSYGQCETTWLIMRFFYWELMQMRNHTYQLQDKWYFESIISELYTHSASSKEQTNTDSKAEDTDIYAKSYAHSSPLPVDITDDVDSEDADNNCIMTPSDDAAIVLPKITSAKSLNVLGAVPFKGQSNKNTTHTKFTNSLDITVPTFPCGIPVTSPQAKAILPTTNIHTDLSTNFNMGCVSQACPATTNSAPVSSTVRPPPPLLPIGVEENLAICGQQNPESKAPATLSLLNSNEIMIELIATPRGNQLVVHGPPLTERYTMSMKTTAEFIREVMAIPVLHNKHTPPSSTNLYWQFLANKFRIPSHVCKACWNFLAENFQHFHQIAPIEELMKPFPTSIKVWKESTALFWRFEALCAERGWLKYQQDLPLLMNEISKYPNVLHSSLIQKPSLPSEIVAMFSHIPDISDICNAFQNVFLAYMHHLESGIDNKWPHTLWRVLANLKFLLDRVYKINEPFYYIIRNKIDEEIKNCEQREASINFSPLAKELLDSSQMIELGSVNDDKTIHKKSVPSTLKTCTIAKSYSLLLSIRQHSDLYLSSDETKRAQAWKKVAEEMDASVNECRTALARTIKRYYDYICRYPADHCGISQKYFLPLCEIKRSIKSKTKLNIKTPSELNLSVVNGSEGSTIVPERFIADINMDNSKPALVLKNMAFAVGSLRVNTQKSMESSLRLIFEKYRRYPA